MGTQGGNRPTAPRISASKIALLRSLPQHQRNTLPP
jgi:hypothetical protein